MNHNAPIRSRLSALALAGLALGMTATASHAAKADARHEAKCKSQNSCKGTTDSAKKDSCKAVASCKGVKDSAAVKQDNSCSGNGKCGGVDAPKTDSSAAILSATTEAAFTEACTKAGKSVAKTSCKGQNSCAGIYFVGSSASKVDCKGHASCKGLVCPL